MVFFYDVTFLLVPQDVNGALKPKISFYFFIVWRILVSPFLKVSFSSLTVVSTRPTFLPQPSSSL